MPNPPYPRLPLLWQSIRHTDVSRLVHRARLEVQRRLQARIKGIRTHGPGPLPVRGTLPKPIFPARVEAGVQGPAGPEARFLNQRWPLPTPMAWHPTARQLEVMNLHYMEYLEGLPDSQVQALIEDWITQNPPYGPGFWRDSWNSYSLSIRCVVWMQQATARALDLEGAWGGALRASLAEQLEFLMRNLELDIRGNHLIKNLKALLWGAAFFAGGVADGWESRASRLLEHELDEQILSDGCHFERSPAYHLQVLADLLECYAVLRPGPLKERLAYVLHSMAEAAVDLCHPDGFPSLFNDGGLRMAYTPGTCLEALRTLTGRAPAPRPAFSFAEAGYFGLRDGGDLLIVDCGAIAPDALPAHGHGDMLAFEWSLAGHRFIVDTGVHEYVEGAARERSRATRAHNTLTLDNLDQCEFWSSFRVGRRGRARVESLILEAGHLDLQGFHTGYQHLRKSPIHHRHFQASPTRIHIQDEVLGGDGQAAEARLLLHPEVQVESCDGKWWLRLPEVDVQLTTSHPVQVERAPWYPDFGQIQETLQLTLGYGTAPCTGRFILEVRRRGMPSTGSAGPVN